MSTTTLRSAAEVALGRQRAPQNADGPHMVRYLRAANVKDGTLDLTDVQSMNFTPAEQRNFALRPGDVLVSEGSGSLSSVGASAVWRGELDEMVCFQNTLLRLRPRAGIDGRYLEWWARSAFGSGVFASIASGANIYHLSAERVRALPISVPPLEEQRRIADFLDAETARMDRLRYSLAQFDGAVHEREQAVLAQMLHPGAEKPGDSLPTGWKWTPLGYLTDQFRQIMYGIVLPGPNVAEGVPIIKGGDVAANRLSLGTLNRTTREIESAYARSRVKGGDLVIAIRGSVGEIAVVPEELTGANLTQDAARISVSSGVSADWLRLVLESPAMVHQIQQRVTGATIKGINIWDLKHVLVPTPSLAEQTSFAASVSQSLGTHEALRSRVARHSALLTERRQALITAAVTGQIDVSTASGRGIEE
ncbi:restriction endonuclease subunit S [Streptomyces sp. MMS24-I2-30]|uniref:restriction endonuclease subunit S n=1 Tax=Streptomyces sp. MMS24-I2-30 TaxID=3351564 RepID=UPI003896CC28